MGASKFLHRILKFINYANLCIFIQKQKKCYFSISQQILILFVLSDRAWWGLRNFYTELWNSLIMQIYANLFKINEKCYFSVISWPILILFGLSDRAWCGLQNFYTEFWKSLIMQIYSKSMKNATFSVISWPIWFCLVYLIGLGGGFKISTTEFWNSLIMPNLFKINEKCLLLCHFLADLILFGLSDRAWWGLQNFYTEFWNSLIMQIYAYLFKSKKNATSLFHSRFWFCLFYLIGLVGASKLLHRIVKFINYANLCKFIQNQWKMPPLLYSEITRDLHLRRGRILRIA